MAYCNSAETHAMRLYGLCAGKFNLDAGLSQIPPDFLRGKWF